MTYVVILVISQVIYRTLCGVFNSCRYLIQDPKGQSGCLKLNKAVIAFGDINFLLSLVPVIVLGASLILIKQVTV